MNIKIVSLALAGIALAWLSSRLQAEAFSQEQPTRPNILWITSEDNASHWLGCYGNRDAQTPRLDALAASGVRFTHAYSNAPVCAVARSTLLNGVYAVSQGTQHMRSRYPIPKQCRPYVAFLRQAGYYCTNNSKTDYNFRGNDRKLWDANSKKAHYKNRGQGQPFFAIFNLTVCHESSLFPERIARNRQSGKIPSETRLDPQALDVPPYLPDLPEVRSDIAIYHDNLTAMDRQVGELLDELKDRSLADDTIVFYYADHGGPTPRGKRYLHDTGVRVPMIVHVPEKWRHWSPFQPGQEVDELVAFVDLAPTVLSLVGEPRPAQMQGRAFLGKHRVAPAADATVFLFGDRFDEIIGMRRGLTDGRYKYIRCFTPHLPGAPCSNYSLSMPSWAAWQSAWGAGELPSKFNRLWESPQPVERLFDTQADPWEVNNLADSPEHAERLRAMRQKLRTRMAAVHDTGIVAEGLFPSLASGGTLHDYVRSNRYPQSEILELAFLASESSTENLPALVAALDHAHPCARYWGALGCMILGERSAPAKAKLEALLQDPQPTLRMTAACGLAAQGHQAQAIGALLAELNRDLSGPESIVLINSLTQVNASDRVPQSWLDRTLNDPDANEYAKRFAKRIRANRDG